LFEQQSTMASQFRETNLYKFFPPPAECLAILVGGAEFLVFGLAGLANAQEFASAFGLPNAESPYDENDKVGENTTTTQNRQTQKALNLAISARNLSHGALILTFALYLRDRRALGYTIGVGFFTTVADYLIVNAYGVQAKAMNHLLGAVNCLALGGSLLYWGRNDPWWGSRL
jgi:hypothetical protein